MSSIVHFDISAADTDRAVSFYQTLFGWKMERMPGFADYYQINTINADGSIGISGGLTKRDQGMPPGITDYIGVTSIDDTLKQLLDLGGKVIYPKQAVPGYGYLAVCADTEDNVFGIFEEEKA